MLRAAFLLFALVGLVGIARVLFGAASDRTGDEWMRWTPSVDLAELAPGKERRLDWNGRGWRVRALRPDEVSGLDTTSGSRENRLLRIELGQDTRWFAVVAARGGCDLAFADGTWSGPCAERYDAIGRALGNAGADLATPDYVIRRGTLHLHPDQGG